MLLLGLLAFLQLLILPGLLLLRILSVYGLSMLDPLETGLLTGSLSLLANYLLAFGLTAIGVWQQPVLLAVISLEIILLLLLPRPQCNSAVTCPLYNITASSTPQLNAAATIVLFFFAAVVCSHLGSVFNSWDDLSSWNKWAIEWTKNKLPSKTGQYPQLIPTVWSLTYVLTNSYIQLFAKAIMPLFSLGSLLWFLMLARTATAIAESTNQQPSVSRSAALLSLIATGYLLLKFGFRHLASGYVDLATTYFTCGTITCLLRGRWSNRPALWALAGASLAAAAACTKQAGLYIAITWPLLTWGLVLKTDKILPRAVQARILAAGMILLLLTVAPWYLYKATAIARTTDSSAVPEILHVVRQAHGYQPSLTRLSNATITFLNALVFAESRRATLSTTVTSLGFALILATALRTQIWRWLLTVLVLPYYLIWALFTSYDFRNLFTILPVLGLGLGLGCTELARWWRKWRSPIIPRPSSHTQLIIWLALAVELTGGIPLIYSSHLRNILVTQLAKIADKPALSIWNNLLSQFGLTLTCAGILSLSRLVWLHTEISSHIRVISCQLRYQPATTLLRISILALLLQIAVPDAWLQALQETSQRRIGLPGLNTQLYAQLSAGGFPGGILTDYPFLRHLPELKTTLFHERLASDLEDITAICRETGGRRPGFLLLRTEHQLLTPSTLAAFATPGHARMLFSQDGYQLFRLDPPPRNLQL